MTGPTKLGTELIFETLKYWGDGPVKCIKENENTSTCKKA
jgi:hypothetical protein